jgi:hypothetical protein
MTTTMRYITKVTSELRVGDVVVEHGMRCLIDREIQVSKSHPVASDGSVCRYTQALVLNRDDEATRAVPVSWTADWKRDGKYEARPHDGEHRWTIQGNDLVRWHVEANSILKDGRGFWVHQGEIRRGPFETIAELDAAMVDGSGGWERYIALGGGNPHTLDGWHSIDPEGR